MVPINKQEKEAIQARFPTAQFTRTCRQDSKRHHYYMAEQPGPMKLLRSLRTPDEIYGGYRNNRRKGERNGY